VSDRKLRVIVLDVPEAELERRLTSRRICSKCKTLSTSLSLYGSEEELCSKCGAMLLTRDDDSIGVIRHRLETYRTTTAPLIEHYAAQGVLSTVNGMRPPEEVTETIFTLLEDKERRRRTRTREQKPGGLARDSNSR
jgi:adenylate kinase